MPQPFQEVLLLQCPWVSASVLPLTTSVFDWAQDVRWPFLPVSCAPPHYCQRYLRVWFVSLCANNAVTAAFSSSMQCDGERLQGQERLGDFQSCGALPGKQGICVQLCCEEAGLDLAGNFRTRGRLTSSLAAQQVFLKLGQWGMALSKDIFFLFLFFLKFP